MQTDGLIFDLDGTLWDSTASCSQAWNQAIKQLGIEHAPITQDDVKRVTGLPYDECFEKAFAGVDPKQRQDLADVSLKIELDTLESKGGDVYPGVLDGIAKLANQIPLFLVSNCTVPYLELFWERTPLKTHFKDWECYGNTNRPKGENLKSVIERNQLKDAVYIGDTGGDHRAANFAGMKYFHVDWGFGEPVGPCWHFGNFNELVEFFLGKP